MVLTRLVRLTLAALLLIGVASAGAADKPRCYGAAARDPQKPCTNPNLRLKVTPTPNQALLRPNSICNRLSVEDLVRTCWWGARKKNSTTTVALIGDSHASAWREATCYDARERAALALTEAVTLIADGGVPDDVWEQAEDEFDGEELGQVLFAIAQINVWNRLNVTVQTEAGHYVPGMFGG